MELREFFSEDAIKLDLVGTTKDDVLRELISLLKLDDKSVVESNVGAEPLTYTHGSRQLIPGLEKALEGLTVGDTKEVTVPPAGA